MRNAEYVDGSFKRLTVNKGTATQTIPLPNIQPTEDEDGRAHGFDEGMHPLPTSKINLVPTLDVYSRIESGDVTSMTDDVKKALDLTFAVENPAKVNLTTGDCVSCHRATHHRAMILTALKVPSFESAEAYVAPSYLDLSNTSEVLKSDPPETSRSQRNFGYFGEMTSISQRTINETAAVVDHLNTVYGGDSFASVKVTGFACDFAKIDKCRAAKGKSCETQFCK